MVVLKNCPFCGGAASRNGTHAWCDLCIPGKLGLFTHKKWNQRAALEEG